MPKREASRRVRELAGDRINLGIGTIRFKYDPFGPHIHKSGPLDTTNYLYDGNALVEAMDGAGNVGARYTDGQVLDETLAELRSGTTSYYQQDALGSVTSLSNSFAALSNTYTFDSFGKPTTSTGTLPNRFQYTGRESDPETGVYYYRARYYDPASGRFLSADPIGFKAGPNFDSYVQNAPTEVGDPLDKSGTDGTDPFLLSGNGGEAELTQVGCGSVASTPFSRG